MEKEKILSTLNEKLGKTNFSAQTIEAYVELNPIAEGAEPDEAYWERAVGFLRKMQGQYNHDFAAHVADFEKNHKSKDTTTETQDKDEKSDLEKRIEQLEQQQKQSAANASRREIAREVVSKGKSLKVANEAIWEDAVSAVEIGDEDSADTVTAKAKTIYERQLRRIIGDGAAPYGSSGRMGASKEAEQEMAARREAFKEQQRKAGRLPKKSN